jgi:hypothetical protein
VRLRRLGFLVALSVCLAGCKTIEFPSVPLPVARAIDGQETPAPFTFLVDTSYRHYDDGMLKWATAQLPRDTLLAWGRYPINRAGQSIERNGYKELTTAELELFRETRLPTLPIIAPDQRILKGEEKDGRALAAKSVEQLTRVLRGWENLSPPGERSFVSRR